MHNLIYLLAGALVFLVQSCSHNAAGTKIHSGESEQRSAPDFKWVEVKSSQPEFSIVVPGELKPYEEVSIFPKAKGFVKKIYVDRGSYVRKGQLLAKLEAPEIVASYAARKSSTGTAYQKFLFSKQSYNRLKEAAGKSGAVATIELERAYAQYLGDSAAYSTSQSEALASGQIRDYLHVVAPFSGIITGRFISEGALIGENGVNGEPLFQLAEQDRLRLTVAIPEKQAQSLPAGTKAQFSVIDYPGKTFTAMLSRNSGALDPRSRSVIAEFDINNDSAVLRAGQYARVTIKLQRPQPTLWVPASSVVQAQSGIFVIKNKNNTTTRVQVQTGIAKDSVMEIFGDLESGDRVLLKGSDEVKEGMQIDP